MRRDSFSTAGGTFNAILASTLINYGFLIFVEKNTESIIHRNEIQSCDIVYHRTIVRLLDFVAKD
jgi:hypothetical protein